MKRTYKSTYGVTRSIAQLISFFGWIAVCFGLFGIVANLSAVINNGGDELHILRAFRATYGTYLSLIGFISGLLIVAGGQITRAVVDTANYNGEMLAIMKSEAMEKKINIG